MAPQINKDEVLIVTKFPAVVEWLKRQGVEGEVKERVTLDEVRDKVVVGALPDRMVKFARMNIRIDVPNVPQGARGKELTADQMEEYDATMYYMVVRKLVLKKAAKNGPKTTDSPI